MPLARFPQLHRNCNRFLGAGLECDRLCAITIVLNDFEDGEYTPVASHARSRLSVTICFSEVFEFLSLIVPSTISCRHSYQLGLFMRKSLAVLLPIVFGISCLAADGQDASGVVHTLIYGKFTGTLELHPVGDGIHMTVVEAISYEDGLGHELDVPANFETDGASIPRALWSIVGSPFSGGNYVEAAVIHDEGCVSHKYDWQTTHMMFYRAMIDSGVSEHYAKVLYYGVRLGGPRWQPPRSAGSLLGKISRTPIAPRSNQMKS